MPLQLLSSTHYLPLQIMHFRSNGNILRIRVHCFEPPSCITEASYEATYLLTSFLGIYRLTIATYHQPRNFEPNIGDRIGPEKNRTRLMIYA